jgi:hypothetical protein
MSEDEYNRLLKQFVQKVKNAIHVRVIFDRLIVAGRKTGRTDLQIGDDIRNEFKGELPDSTIRKYLPESFKHTEKGNMRYRSASAKQLTNNNKEIDIPPPKQEIKEVEPESRYLGDIGKDQSKEFDVEYIPEVILDCQKFRTELRMGTLNNAKLRLQVKNNEVVKIT